MLPYAKRILLENACLLNQSEITCFEPIQVCNSAYSLLFNNSFAIFLLYDFQIKVLSPFGEESHRTSPQRVESGRDLTCVRFESIVKQFVEKNVPMSGFAGAFGTIFSLRRKENCKLRTMMIKLE